MPRAVRFLLATIFVCTNAAIAFAQQPEFDQPSIGAFKLNNELPPGVADAIRREQEARKARKLWEREQRERPRHEREPDPVVESPEVSVTPEPLTLGLLATGLLGLGVARLRRRTD